MNSLHERSVVVFFNLQLLMCFIVSVAWLFVLLFLFCALFPPAAAGLLIVLRLSIDKDIDRYHSSESIRPSMKDLYVSLLEPVDF